MDRAREHRAWAWLELGIGVAWAAVAAYFALRFSSISLVAVAIGLVALGVTWFIQPVPLNEPSGYMRRNGIRLKPHVTDLMIAGWLLVIGGGAMRWCCDL